MSKKAKLPDEILDAVSGGHLYLGDEQVRSHEITKEGFTVTTDSGTYYMKGNPDFYADKPGQFDSDKATIDSAASSSDSHFTLHAHLFQKV